MPKRKSKKHFYTWITEYGIHIWAILIFANAALAYTFHYSTQAAQQQNTESEITADDIGQPINPSGEVINEPSLPKGPVIDFSFTLPEIGNKGATLIPKRLKRNLTVYLYSTDANILNKNVKPLYIIKTTAQFDNDPNSPTYTTYYNHAIDLGADVKESDYQLAFRTDESLRTIIKETPDNVGGQIFNLSKGSGALILPIQTFLMGDTIPDDGDNLIDINDYNAFMNCFGEKNNSEFCSAKNYGDFDDNGVIDGVDYNLLLRTFKILVKEGQTIPQILTTPKAPGRVSRLFQDSSPTPKKSSPIPSPTQKASDKTSKTSSSNIGAIFFFLFLFLVVTGVVLYIKNEKLRNKIKSILHLSPNALGSATQPKTENEVVQSPTDPSEIAASTEIPVEQIQDTNTQSPIPTTDGVIEKECFVKNIKPDDDKSGFWLTLTDDNGPMDAHYKGGSVTDGFAKVKGTMKSDNGKNYLEITEVTSEA